jgi:hypothetical protein
MPSGIVRDLVLRLASRLPRAGYARILDGRKHTSRSSDVDGLERRVSSAARTDN